MTQIYFLEADVPLTKKYRAFPSRIETTSYPLVSKFTSHVREAETLEDFYDALVDQGEQGRCLIKGELHRTLVDESRAGATTASDETDWVCLDIDGLPLETPEEFMQAMGFGDISYVVQFSSSYKVKDDLLRCHIFMFLDRHIAAPLLKQWLIGLNFSVPLLKDNLILSPSQNFLHWPLDITTCQNDKLLYIAPPTLIGLDPQIEYRYQLVEKDVSFLSLPAQIPNITTNRKAIDTHINELREAAGLPKRRASKYSHAGPVEYMANPDQAMVTSSKEERGFMYLNLNGGDSWAYYHPVDKFEFIYNFKGEPTYRTQDLVPDYWYQCLKQQDDEIDAGQQTLHLAYRDFYTAHYYNGFYYPESQQLDLARAASEKQLADFMTQHGRHMPDVVPVWRMEFLPEEDWIVQRQEQRINTFVPTEYCRRRPAVNAKKVPRTIEKIIYHALGSDQECYEHFINWLATAFQKKRAIGTAWVLSGTHGTGKGLLCHRILAPIVGREYVVQKRMDELSEKFNDFMKKTLFLFIDEAKLGELSDGDILMQKIKNLITEEVISVRGMHQAALSVPNYVNWIIASNATNPIILEQNDRRFNVATFQPKRIELSQAEMAQIDRELQSFCDYLRNYEIDEERARTLLNNEQRQRLMVVSTTSVDLACQAIMAGDLEFFLNELPTDNVTYMDARQQHKLRIYREVMTEIVNTNPRVLSRDALRVLLDFVVPNLPQTANKFTAMLRHHGIFVGAVHIDGETVRGIRISWRIPGHAKATLTDQKAG